MANDGVEKESYVVIFVKVQKIYIEITGYYNLTLRFI